MTRKRRKIDWPSVAIVAAFVIITIAILWTGMSG